MNLKLFLLIVFIGLLLSKSFAQNIKTEKRIENDSVKIDFINNFYAPVEFQISAKESENIPIKFNKRIIIKSRSTFRNAISYPVEALKDSTKNFTDYINFKGNLSYKENIKIDEDFEYVLPFKKGKKYKIIQGFNGRFSHNLISSKYAIDFNFKVGDTVYASRKGIVVIAKKDSKEFGKNRSFSGKANKVIVYHDDGTLASYVHLKYDEVFVQEGDEVIVGQPLGLVGMSGFTTTPHLHFVVHKERGIAVPIQFKGVKKLNSGKKILQKF